MVVGSKIVSITKLALLATLLQALALITTARASYPDFYVERNQAGLSFVLEKVDSSNINKWNRFEEEQTLLRNRLLGKIQQIELELSEGANVEGLHPSLQKIYPHIDVIRAAEDPLEKFRKGLHHFSKADVFVCYATDLALDTKIDEANMKDIQIAMLVLTRYGLPFQVHMGIGKGLHVIVSGNVRNGLAAPLHGLAAKKFRQWDPTKLLFMTTPVPVMREILVKRLPQGTYWQDPTWNGEIKDENRLVEYDHDSPKDCPMIVRNFQGDIIFQYKPGGENFDWFFHNLQLKSPTWALVVIDLAALEKLFV